MLGGLNITHEASYSYWINFGNIKFLEIPSESIQYPFVKSNRIRRLALYSTGKDKAINYTSQVV